MGEDKADLALRLSEATIEELLRRHVLDGNALDRIFGAASLPADNAEAAALRKRLFLALPTRLEAIDKDNDPRTED